MSNYYHCLGLENGADRAAIDKAALKLMSALSRGCKSARADEQADIARHGVRTAYEALTAEGYEVQVTSPAVGRMRLGQICLASGMITLDQLQAAMKEQRASGKQLGEILLDRQYISQEELDGLLIGQDLIAPDEISNPLALQLIALNLVAEELMIVALLEQRFASDTLGDQLVRRGWIEREVIDALI